MKFLASKTGNFNAYESTGGSTQAKFLFNNKQPILFTRLNEFMSARETLLTRIVAKVEEIE